MRIPIITAIVLAVLSLVPAQAKTLPLPAKTVADVRAALAAAPYNRELAVRSLHRATKAPVLCGLVDVGRRGMPLRFIYTVQKAGPPDIKIDDRTATPTFDATWAAAGC